MAAQDDVRVVYVLVTNEDVQTVDQVNITDVKTSLCLAKTHLLRVLLFQHQRENDCHFRRHCRRHCCLQRAAVGKELELFGIPLRYRLSRGQLQFPQQDSNKQVKARCR